MKRKSRVEFSTTQFPGQLHGGILSTKQAKTMAQIIKTVAHLKTLNLMIIVRNIETGESMHEFIDPSASLEQITLKLREAQKEVGA